MASFYGVVAIFMWGSLALLGTITAEIPAFQLLFLCFIVSGFLMILKRIALKQPVLSKPNLTLTQWLVGVLALFGFHFCYFMALKKAPAIEVSLISYLWPMLLAIFVSNKANQFKALLGGLIGFVGVSFIIVGDKGFSFDQQYIQGYFLAACCALLWSSYSWFLSKSDNHVDDIGWLSFVVALLSLFAHLYLENSYWHFDFTLFFGVLLLGLGPVGGAFYLWDMGLKSGNKKLLASLSFCTPLISSVILAIAGLNSFSVNIIIALAFILLGALITNIKIPNKKILNSTTF